MLNLNAEWGVGSHTRLGVATMPRRKNGVVALWAFFIVTHLEDHQCDQSYFCHPGMSACQLLLSFFTFFFIIILIFLFLLSCRDKRLSVPLKTVQQPAEITKTVLSLGRYKFPKKEVWKGNFIYFLKRQMSNWGLCEGGEVDNIKQQNNQQTLYRLLARKTKANTLRGRDGSKRRDFFANTEPV